mmetsp:Transcript_15233/g.19300  ORF Transcript_15233/g.19300 Transcript_15233/m.19300 type:complete len:102 (-) Transcript_15233:7-312(-)
MPTKVAFFEKRHMKDVVAGQFHTLALTADNELYAWGRGDYGRLGLGVTDTMGVPKKVVFADGCVNTSASLMAGQHDRSVGGSDDRSADIEMLRTMGGSDTS